MRLLYIKKFNVTETCSENIAKTDTASDNCDCRTGSCMKGLPRACRASGPLFCSVFGALPQKYSITLPLSHGTRSVWCFPLRYRAAPSRPYISATRKTFSMASSNGAPNGGAHNMDYITSQLETLGISQIPTFPGVQLYPGNNPCLLYTSPSPRDRTRSRMPSSA